MIIRNATRQTLIASEAELADTVCSRLVGLLNRSSLSPRQALIITQCRQIHMFFMRFTIDVIFVDKKDRVVGLVPGIRPWRMSRYFFRANRAIELCPEAIAASQTEIGDKIEIEDKGP